MTPVTHRLQEQLQELKAKAASVAAETETFSAPVAVIDNAPDALLDSISAYVVEQGTPEVADSFEQDIALIADDLAEPELDPSEPDVSQAEVVFLMPDTAGELCEVAETTEALESPAVPVEADSAEAEWPWSAVAEEIADIAAKQTSAVVHPNPLLAARVSIEDLNAGEPITEPEEIEAARPAGEDDSISGFILDLQEIPEEAPVQAEAEPPGYRPTENACADMTCQDCIYLETCPNSNERDPASCGSFQWK